VLRILLLLGLLVLVPTLIVLWRTGDRAPAESRAADSAHTMSPKPIGTSTLSHGNALRSQDAGKPSDNLDRR
jgi:hypothetical protein